MAWISESEGGRGQVTHVPDIQDELMRMRISLPSAPMKPIPSLLPGVPLQSELEGEVKNLSSCPPCKVGELVAAGQRCPLVPWVEKPPLPTASPF